MKMQNGFSLFEAVCVLAVLSLLAYSSSRFLYSSKQVIDQQTTLLSALASLESGLIKARHLAVHVGEVTYLCGGLSCDGDWSHGYHITFDSEAREAFDTNLSMTFPEGITVTWKGFPAKKRHIEFHPNGLTGYQNGSFYFCLNHWGAKVVLNQAGRFYSSKVSKGVELCTDILDEKEA